MAIITNLQPPAGTTVGANSALTFDVIDPVIEELDVKVWVVFKATGQVELAHDGDNWQPNYSFSTIESIPGGRRFTVLRVSGWPHQPELRADACACPPDIGEYGPQTLAETLALGNESGGRDIILSDEDDLLPESSGGSSIGSSTLPFLALHTPGALRSGVRLTTSGAATDSAVLATLTAEDACRIQATALGVSATADSVVVVKLDATFYFTSGGDAALLVSDRAQTDLVGLASSTAAFTLADESVSIEVTGEAAHDITWTVSYEIARVV